MSDVPDHATADHELAATRGELAAAKAELQATIESYRAFAYSISHDLRAPLRAIAGFASMLEETPPAEMNEDARHFLAVICDNVRLLNAQIDGLLVISRLEHRELRLEPVDMTVVAQTAVDEVRAHEPTRAVQATIGTLAPARADRELVRIALAELVKNAWKFTRDRPHATMEIASERRGAETVYSVRDNGVGFKPGAAERLFTVFHRLHSPKEYEGLGIGLAAVKVVVGRHRGKVWAESEPGRGTTVSFTLPAAE